jgi:Replication-relaxation
LGFVSRSQLQIIHNLKSDRNALKVLGEMKEYLHVKPSPERSNENIYYLNKNGCEYVGQNEERRWVQSVEHYLMRNDLFIHYQQPNPFNIEPEIVLREGMTQKIIKPDATFIRDNQYYFLEVDRTQKMNENKKKLESYAELFPLIKSTLKQTPILVFYTLSHIRKDKISGWCNEMNLPFEIICRDDLR